jgi:hypothetical protein
MRTRKKIYTHALEGLLVSIQKRHVHEPTKKKDAYLSELRRNAVIQITIAVEMARAN